MSAFFFHPRRSARTLIKPAIYSLGYGLRLFNNVCKLFMSWKMLPQFNSEKLGSWPGSTLRWRQPVSPKNQLSFLILRGSFCKQTHEFLFPFSDKNISFSCQQQKNSARAEIKFTRNGWMVKTDCHTTSAWHHCWLRNSLFASAAMCTFFRNSIHVCIIYEINNARRLQGCNYFNNILVPDAANKSGCKKLGLKLLIKVQQSFW